MKLPNPSQDRADELCRRLASGNGEVAKPTQQVKDALGIGDQPNRAEAARDVIVGGKPADRKDQKQVGQQTGLAKSPQLGGR